MCLDIQPKKKKKKKKEDFLRVRIATCILGWVSVFINATV